jgi:hypothetical protein
MKEPIASEMRKTTQAIGIRGTNDTMPRSRATMSTAAAAKTAISVARKAKYVAIFLMRGPFFGGGYLRKR